MAAFRVHSKLVQCRASTCRGSVAAATRVAPARVEVVGTRLFRSKMLMPFQSQFEVNSMGSSWMEHSINFNGADQNGRQPGRQAALAGAAEESIGA